jgi:hypothetical protein
MVVRKIRFSTIFIVFTPNISGNLVILVAGGTGYALPVLWFC